MDVPPITWGKLARLCKYLHTLVYVRCDRKRARTVLPRLERMLTEISHDDQAIVGAEARALYHELKGEYELAIQHRTRELMLMDALYEDIRIQDYDRDAENWLFAQQRPRCLRGENGDSRITEIADGFASIMRASRRWQIDSRQFV